MRGPPENGAACPVLRTSGEHGLKCRNECGAGRKGHVGPPALLQQIKHAVVQNRQCERRRANPFPAGEPAMLETGKHVEALRVSGDGFGDEATRYATQREAVSRKSLQVIDVVAHAAKIGGEIQADIDKTSPGVSNGEVRKLRKNIQHALADLRHQFARPSLAVAFAAAK